MTASKQTKTATESVSLEYKHYGKFVEPDENIVMQSSTLKWYNLAKSEEPVPNEINAMAREFLKKESPQNLGELGFVILHRCGKDFYFLLVSTWRNGNELWESVYAKDGVKDKDFALFTFETEHRGTFCVWELAVVYHEKNAWRNYLLSTRNELDKVEYLQDRYRGAA